MIVSSVSGPGRRFQVRTGLSLAVAAFALGAAGCGGSGSVGLPGSPPTAAPPNATAPNKTATVAVKIVWPKAQSTAVRGRRNYISPSTASVTIAVDGGTPISVNNPNVTGSGANASSTIADVPAPVGADTFAVNAYDKVSGGGNLLSGNTIPFTVVADTLNTLGVTLNGNLGTIGCAAVAPFVTEASNAFTQVGPTGQLELLPEDSDGNVIIAPGDIPAVTLTGPAKSATITPAASTNTYNTNILVTGTAVALTASGKNLAGDTVSTTCSITRVLAMYVTNDDILGTNPSISIYPASATGDATPVATIKGSNTAETAIQFPAVDAAGNLFVTNEGPVPGSTYGPTSGYISVYSPGTGQIGNVAPAATIPGFNRPEGISFDPSGNLWVVSLDRIQEYLGASDGASAPAVVNNTITGAATQLTTCYGLTVTSTTIYTTCTPYPFYIAYWPIATTGNVAPTQMTYVGAVAAAGMTVSYSTVSWLSIAVDSSGTMYTPDTNDNENAVYGFTSGSSGMTPALVDAKIGFNLPSSIFIDSNGTFYVTNYGNNTIETFSSEADLLLGDAATTLSGTDTGLDFPYGVYVR